MVHFESVAEKTMYELGCSHTYAKVYVEMERMASEFRLNPNVLKTLRDLNDRLVAAGVPEGR